jgi:ribosomal 50S subunit-associated protein YjgA (DUF615 family)
MPRRPTRHSPRQRVAVQTVAAAGEADAGGERPADERPSRSARKRQALALQELGVRLTRLRPAQLLRLELPEELLGAVLEAQRLHSRAARARQRQYIGRLMRAVDPEPIEQALQACGPPPQRQC